MLHSFRRQMIAFLMIAVLLCAVLPTQGCSSATTVAEINTVLNEAGNILTVVDPSAPWVPQFKAAVTALETAENSWQAGGTVQDVVTALNTVVAVTASIPVTATYSPLVDVFVAAVEAILEALPASSAVSVMSPMRGTTARTNPHIGRVVIHHHLLHSRVGEFKSAWNQVVAANPSLAHAALK